MPVFSIHGAQDCPSVESLTSSLDVLHHAGLLNYVGKLTQFDEIEIKPIIFERKKTKLALYFLGHIREVKLTALLATKKLKFKPADPGYMKILVVNQTRERGDRNPAFPKLEVHPEDFNYNFDLIIWGGEAEAIDKLEEVGDAKLVIPGSLVVHRFRKSDVRPKSVTLLKIRQGKATMTQIPLSTSRPFIYRQIYASKLEETLKNNPSMKTLDAVLEKEIMYLIREYYTQAERGGASAGLKPLAKFRVKFSPTSVVETDHLEARLKDLVLSFPAGKVIELVRTAASSLVPKRNMEQMKDARSLLTALSDGTLAGATSAEVSQIGAYVSDAIRGSRVSSPFLGELMKDPERYLDGSDHVLNTLISRYENAFKDEFTSGPAEEHSKGMRRFLESTADRISTLESISTRPADLDAFSLQIRNRIDDAFHFTTAARKYVSAHRTATKSLGEYLTSADERIQREMDELIQEARGKGDSLGKRDSDEHPGIQESLVRRLAALPMAGEVMKQEPQEDVSGEESEGENQRSRDMMRLNALAATIQKPKRTPKKQNTSELDDISEDDDISYTKIKEWNSPTGSKILEDELMDVVPKYSKNT